ncbi:hypothetical protein REIS_0153 [Rickettsia endosymbiont of Ixodes scapularis]|nr:hypothetical protein REIS_0153 [Rickettsia endosymbiont of Ixodes scapularis]
MLLKNGQCLFKNWAMALNQFAILCDTKFTKLGKWRNRTYTKNLTDPKN